MNRYIKKSQTGALVPRWLVNHRLFAVQSVVFLCLLINAFRPSTVPDVIILALALVAPIFLKSTEIVAYIAGFAMMGTGIQIAYVALAAFAILFVKSNFKIKAESFVAILVFLLFELSHFLTSPSDEMMELIRYAVVYVLLFYLMFMDYSVKDRLAAVNSYMYGTLVAVIHVFVEMYNAFGGDMTKFTDGTFRFGYAEQLGVDLTMAADPNLVGQSCSLVIVFSLTLIMLGYRKKRYFIGTFLALFVGTLTISKTFLISLIIIVALMLLFVGSWGSYKMIKRRLLIILIVVLGSYLITKINPEYINNILARVNAEDITTGRADNALIYLEYLMNDIGAMFFGVGMQNVGDKIGFTGSPHAALIESAVCWGLVGTVLLIGIIVKAILHHKGNTKFKMLNYIPLIVFTVLVQSTQLFRLRDRVFALLVVILIAGIPQKGEKLNGAQEECSIDN